MKNLIDMPSSIIRHILQSNNLKYRLLERLVCKMVKIESTLSNDMPENGNPVVS